jgi:hypothetical protein
MSDTPVILGAAALIIAELGVIVCQVTRRPPLAAPVVATGPTRAIADVIAERRRQIVEERWTPKHDDEHAPGDLSAAGACYAMYAAETQLRDELPPCDCPPPRWPWDRAWWKPNGVRRALVKAAALLIAEIEKIDRADVRAAATGGNVVALPQTDRVR